MRYVGMPPSPGALLDGSDYRLVVGDVDGDGRDEAVLLNSRLPSLAVLSTFDYGDLGVSDWPHGGDPQLLGSSTAVGTTSGGWQLRATDVLTAADLDGDGRTEVVIHQPASGYLGVIAWNGDGLECTWGADTLLAQMGLSPGSTHLLAADVDGDGRTELVAVDASTPGIGVIGWDGTALVARTTTPSTVPPGLTLGDDDQLVTRTSSVDPGQQQVIVVGGGGTTLTTLQWVGSDGGLSLNATTTTGTIPVGPASRTGTADWAMAAGDRYTVADLDADGLDELVVLSAAGLLGVLRWDDDGGFTVECSTTLTDPGDTLVALLTARPTDLGAQVIVTTAPADGSIRLTSWALAAPGAGPALTEQGTASFAAGAWPAYLDTATLHVAADLDGDGLDELLLLSPTGQAVGVLRLVGGTWAETITVTRRLGGYGPSLLAAGPVSTFVPFTGTQGDIYAQVGTSLEPSAGTDLRTQYTNGNNVDHFGDWGTTIGSATAATPGWQWLAGYAEADVRAVLDVLAAECGDVDTCYGHYTLVQEQLVPLRVKRDADVLQCQRTISTTPTRLSTSGATVDYWVEGVLTAVLWGAAAVPGVGAVAVPLAMFASIMGTVFGAISNGSRPPPAPPKTADYAALSASLDDDFVDAWSTLADELDVVVTDPVKLHLLGSLLEGPWAMSMAQVSAYIEASSASNRLAFYQTLLPQAFSIGVFDAGYPLPYPGSWHYDTFDSGGKFERIKGVPPDSFTTEGPYGSPAYYIVRWWCVCTFEQSWPVVTANPSQALMDDVFTTLGVPTDDFFTGRNGWNLPTFEGDFLGRGP